MTASSMTAASLSTMAWSRPFGPRIARHSRVSLSPRLSRGFRGGRLRQRRYVGGRGHDEALGFLGLHVRQDRRDRAAINVDMLAEEVLQRLAGAAERDGDRLDIAGLEDAFGRQLHRAADAVVAVGVLVRVGGELGQELFARLGRKLRMDAQRVGRLGGRGDGREAVERVGDVLDLRHGGQRAVPGGEERVAVGLGLHELRGADRAAAAADIQHGDRGAELLFQQQGQLAGAGVGAAAGAGRDGEFDGALGIVGKSGMEVQPSRAAATMILLIFMLFLSVRRLLSADFAAVVELRGTAAGDAPLDGRSVDVEGGSPDDRQRVAGFQLQPRRDLLAARPKDRSSVARFTSTPKRSK